MSLVEPKMIELYQHKCVLSNIRKKISLKIEINLKIYFYFLTIKKNTPKTYNHNIDINFSKVYGLDYYNHRGSPSGKNVYSCLDDQTWSSYI